MAKEKDIILANHHTASIVLPRIYNPNVSGDPAQMTIRVDSVIIAPGHTHVMTATEWELRKSSEALQYYLDHHILSLVKRTGEVDITTDVTKELEVPEHLQADEDGNVTVTSSADGSAIKAGIRSAKKSSITV